METLCGFEGNKNLLEADEYKHYLDDLGEKHQVMELYFKPYTYCRWAHPVIDACIQLLEKYQLTADKIRHVTVKTFHRATLLSKIVPKTVDEAQYNIAYPVAAALIYRDFGYAQVRQESLGDPKVVAMMDKLYETATGTANVFATTDIEEVTEGTDGIFAKKQMSTESKPRQIYEVNTGSTYHGMVAPTLYGGYRLWTPMWQQDRVRLPQEHDLQVGDILIGKVLSSRVIYLYAGPELGFVNLNKATLDADTVTVAQRLERLLGYGYYFAILRPSMTLS